MSAALSHPAVARIALSLITPSPTNPRKRFDQAALDELTANVKRLDVLQPILLRPNGGPGQYELVAGERRFRAAKAAGLVDIPATVRELTDAEVLEIQVVENLQRQDLHELEEAEGYEKLLKCTHANGDKYTVDEIATKVGKSRTTVFGRLKLLHLCPEARKAFYAGEIDGQKALLIARIGHHDTQRQALKDITKGPYGNGEPMSYRHAHDHILRNYMLKLSEAPFDTKDEKLLSKAGACGPCPKRTGNQADLFGDVKSADVCTDPKCFDDKRQAHYSVAARELESKGHKVISGEAAKKLIPQWERHTGKHDYISLAGGYLKHEETTYANGRSQKISALLGEDYEPTLLQHPGTGQIIKVVTQQAVTAAAAKRQKAKGGDRASSAGRASSQPRERVKSPDEIYRDRLFVEIFKKLPAQPGRSEWNVLADAALMNMEGSDLIADQLAPRKDGKPHDYQSGGDALKKLIPTLMLGEVAKIVVATEISQRCYSAKELEAMAKRYKVDPAKVKKTIADEAKAAAEKAKEAKPVKKVKKVKK